METIPLAPFKVVIDGIKEAGEKPINSVINVENAIRRVRGIV